MQKNDLPAVNETIPVASSSRLPPTRSPSPEKPLNTAFASEWPPSIHNPGVGLYNEGNTCYLNATLQALVHSPAFVSALLVDHSHTSGLCAVAGFCALCALHKMMVTAFHGVSKSSKRAFAFTGNLRKIASHFRAGRQEDAHEFLRFLLDAMQSNCLARYSPATLKANPSLREQTLIHHLFAGKFRSRVTCSQCGNNSDTFDTFLDLSLYISNLPHLRSALTHMVKPDELRGQNKYKCEECKKLVDARKQLSIERVPHVLTVHFKRFTATGRKITSIIQYDEYLDLGPYTSERSADAKYRLDAIISHSGSGPHSGHYYSHVRGPHNKWYKMDDSSVSPIHQGSRVLLGLKTAYILLYTRCTHSQPKGQVQSTSSSPAKQVQSTSSSPAAFIGPQRPGDLKRKHEDFSSQSVTDPSPTPLAANPFSIKRPKTEDVGEAVSTQRPLNGIAPGASLLHRRPSLSKTYANHQKPNFYGITAGQNRR